MKLIAKIVTLLVILSAAPAFAQETANAFRPFEIGWNALSYTRQSSSNFYGGDLSMTFYPKKSVGLVADVSIQQSNELGQDFTLTSYRFGVKLRRPLGGRFTYFGEFLAGGARLSSSSAHTSGFAGAIGGGLDLGIRPWIAWRMVQYDYSYLYFSSSSSSSNGFRLGTGLVFRMGPH